MTSSHTKPPLSAASTMMFARSFRSVTRDLSDDDILQGQVKRKPPTMEKLASMVDALEQRIDDPAFKLQAETKRQWDARQTQRFRDIRNRVVEIELATCGKTLHKTKGSRAKGFGSHFVGSLRQGKKPAITVAAQKNDPERVQLQSRVQTISRMLDDVGSRYGVPPLSRADLCTLGAELDLLRLDAENLSTAQDYVLDLDALNPLETLGEGAFGRVLLVEDKHGHLFALKSQSLAKYADLAMAELNIMERLGCDVPFVVGFHGALEQDNTLYFLLEYVDGGDLFARMNKAPIREEEARYIMASVLLGVSHLHNFGIIHLDLKPENVLLTSSGVPKIADFGLSHDCGNLLMPRLEDVARGSPEYCAPEIFEHAEVGPPADIWSLGILLYFMLKREWPFFSDSGLPKEAGMQQLIERINRWDVRFESDAVSDEAQSLIRGMLVKDPQQRITYEGIVQHPFFAAVGGGKYFAKLLQGKVKPPRASAPYPTSTE